MTDREIAEEYYYKNYTVTLNVGEENRKEKVINIFLAGLEASKPKWHDLRKDPNDLPLMIEDERKISNNVYIHVKNWGN